MINYLLDTNICIFTIKRKPPEIREQFRWHHGQMAISAVTLMELIYGAEKSQAHPTCGSSSGFPDCVSWIGYNDLVTGSSREAGPLFHGIHDAFWAGLQADYDLNQGFAQQPQQQDGDFLSQFMSSGFGRTIEMGAGFGIGNDLINRIL